MSVNNLCANKKASGPALVLVGFGLIFFALYASYLTPPNCVPHNYYKCFNDDLYWYDSCNNLEEIKEDCTDQCQDNECISDNIICTNECISGTKQCSGNGYQTCGNYDSDSCTEWSSVTNCPSGQSCSNGVCTGETCIHTCISKGYTCGTATICGIPTNCGDCAIGKVCTNGQCVEQKGNYHFEYPADKKDGYYALSEHEISTGMDMYKIIPGYVEDFTYDANRPIIGDWQIKDYNSFYNLCIVGACTQYATRNVICINQQGIMDINEQYQCNKWQYPFSRAGKFSSYCDTICNTNYVIGVYYVYNTWPGYEGYDTTWKSRWSVHLSNMAQFYKDKYHINIQYIYKEIKLNDNSNLPGAIFNTVWQGSSEIIPGTNAQISIIAGNKFPSDYGLSCPGTTPQNPCSGHSGIRIPDYYDTVRNQGYHVLIHEAGHNLFSCPHTGMPNSFASTLYKGDIISYGVSFNYPDGDFLYDCRVLAWSKTKQDIQ